MNPSAPGWIKKHLPYFLEHTLHLIESENVLYERFRESGFIYGTSIHTLGDEESAQLKWTELEKTKINLFDGLLFTYYDTIENAKSQDALEHIIEFYSKLNESNDGYTLSLGHKSAPNESVEKIIHERVQTNEPLLQKTFSHLITNALLYIDVLAFDHFLLTSQHPILYAKQLETIVTQVVWLALCKKEQKDTYDGLLIKLFESSLRYSESINEHATSLHDIPLHELSQPLERQYIIDVASLAIWDDVVLDRKEYEYIRQLGKLLDIQNSELENSINSVHKFIKEHYDSIAFLQHSNPMQHFYNQTSKTVSNLILRNKKRLIKEVTQSKDLMILLGQSTIRDLDSKERKLVKTQLLDICKSIPSLAIFLLPGGGLLLPLLMKFIPQLLPSAFNENYTDVD